MKRIKYLEDGRTIYEHICDEDNILEAIKDACKDHHKDPQVIMMKENPEKYVEQIREILVSKSFHYSKFRTCDIVERGKRRHLCFTITYPDRVIQHAVLRIVGPILLGTSIKSTYAAQEGKGTHLCSVDVRKAIRNDPEGTKYYLKTDIKKYFDSILRDILWNFIKRKIKCKDTLEILHRLIFEVSGRIGLAIGLYISQILSTYFLSSFDHWVKEVLHIKHYFRYMDDCVFFSDSKEILHRVRKIVEAKLRDEFGLKLKKNWRIAPITCGLDFVGFVHFPTHTKIRKSVKIAYKRVVNAILKRLKEHRSVDKHIMGALNSYDGMVKWSDGARLRYLNMGRVDIALEFGVEAI